MPNLTTPHEQNRSTYSGSGTKSDHSVRHGTTDIRRRDPAAKVCLLFPVLRQSITYTGRVQGVGFRATTRRVAEAFAVSGWVRNEPDGSVRVEVQGEGAEIDRFRDAVRQRLGANVKSESSSDLPVQEAESSFSIRY